MKRILEKNKKRKPRKEVRRGGKNTQSFSRYLHNCFRGILYFRACTLFLREYVLRDHRKEEKKKRMGGYRLFGIGLGREEKIIYGGKSKGFGQRQSCRWKK
jgi:hypothetical protein